MLWLFGRLRFRLYRLFGRVIEIIRYQFVAGAQETRFVIVSCQRNAGNAVVKCLDSIYRQEYNRNLVEHVLVDDVSTDHTPDLIEAWLNQHPDSSVHYHRREKHMGEAANNQWGIEYADDDSIVLIVDGDDWLSDSGVLAFLDKVYRSPQVWMTYNSMKFSSAGVSDSSLPYPKHVVNTNAFRDYPDWCCTHLRSFRKNLFNKLDKKVFLDPETGDHWERAYDQAFFLALLELSGEHARHLFRINYVYNEREISHVRFEPELLQKTAARIRQIERCQPLESLRI